MRAVIVCLLLAGACFLLAAPAGAAEKDRKECFKTSLHYTTRGMAHWYDAKDGFSAVTGVPYAKLGCKKGCHVTSCEDCHLIEDECGCLSYSVDKARESATCLKCHAREKATIGMDKARGTEGVHCGVLECADCHTAREVHGDGTCYESMRQPGCLEASCTNCHKKEGEGGDYTDVPTTMSHRIHKEKLDCTACHVSNTMTCYNCHFGVFKETGKKPLSFTAKAKDFLLLVKYQGKIMSGTLQTLVGFDNYPFVTYVPYFTHSVMAEGRKCEQCHGTEAAKTLAAGKKYAPVEFKDGKLVFKPGVVPLAPKQLDWVYLEKKGDKWQPFEPAQEPMVQLGVYSEPLSAKDLEQMSKKQTYKQ